MRLRRVCLLVRRLRCRLASDASCFRSLQVALIVTPVGRTPDCVGSAPDPLPVLVPEGCHCSGLHSRSTYRKARRGEVRDGRAGKDVWRAGVVDVGV
jgi:hypothetical protein